MKYPIKHKYRISKPREVNVDILINFYLKDRKNAVECYGYESMGTDGKFYVLLPYDKNGNWNNDKITFNSRQEAIDFCKKIKVKFVED